jgi:2-polyprenyl-3-methyl-5-hydroxy-6-metoxy-1,4-benzoquinol methylase
VACEVIEHVAHGDRMLEHLKRFLLPRGTLMLTTPNGSFFRSRLATHSQVTDFRALESKQFKPDADGHLFLYTPKELRRLLEDTGFQDTRLELSVTPFISGAAGFRFMPQLRILTGLYLAMDRAVRGLGSGVRQRVCEHLVAVAHA